MLHFVTSYIKQNKSRKQNSRECTERTEGGQGVGQGFFTPHYTSGSHYSNDYPSSVYDDYIQQKRKKWLRQAPPLACYIRYGPVNLH